MIGFPVFKSMRRYVKNVDIGTRSRSRVYRISENYVAKFPRPFPHFDRCRERRYVDALEKEFLIAKELYGAGISVPNPEGMFLTSLRKPLFGLLPAREYPVFLMEYIKGVTLEETSCEDGRTLINLAELELEKTRELGFVANDTHLSNTLWSPQRKRIYLIDFEHWKREK